MRLAIDTDVASIRFPAIEQHTIARSFNGEKSLGNHNEPYDVLPADSAMNQ
jgi:hypothetical protein